MIPFVKPEPHSQRWMLAYDCDSFRYAGFVSVRNEPRTFPPEQYLCAPCVAVGVEALVIWHSLKLHYKLFACHSLNILQREALVSVCTIKHELGKRFMISSFP